VLDATASEDEAKRAEEWEQQALIAFIEACMTLRERTEFNEWSLATFQHRNSPEDAGPWPPCFLTAAKRASLDPIVDPEVFLEKYVRLQFMRHSPEMLRPFNDAETQEIHALNCYFNHFFTWVPATPEMVKDKNSNEYQHCLQEWIKGLKSAGVTEGKIRFLVEN